MEIVIYVVVAIVCLAVGFVVSRVVSGNGAKSAMAEAERKLADAEKSAENIRREATIEAKDEALRIKQQAEEEARRQTEEVRQQSKDMQARSERLEQRENSLDKRSSGLDKREQQLNGLQSRTESLSKKLETKLEEAERRLLDVASLSKEEAREIVLEDIREDCTAEAAGIIRDIESRTKAEANRKSREILSVAIQRMAADYTAERTVTSVQIPSDDIKGRIIGREGRNIRALEAATGIEIIVDDTPEAIILSGFDPVRREIARLALHQLVTDGRIHPARIEEVVAKVQKQIEEEIVEVGKRTAIDLGIHGLHPELIRLIGKMKYRSSYGQNLLQHARETANLAGIMASELGLNPKIARRAGLLHDIGKVPDDEPELPHAIIGMKLAEKYKEKPDVCNAIGAHHDEVEMTSIVAPIIQVCDAISGARPGARREVVESYIKRLKEMEEIALSYPGVQKTYAIQAGRELRVIVGADKLSDQESEGLSRDIAKKIQDEMTYPGQVKITVIRETRAVAYAK